MPRTKICCVCSHELQPGENYYSIDGIRLWCVECGPAWLREQHPGYQDYKNRVARALASGQENWERRAIVKARAKR